MDLMLGRGKTAPVYPWFGQDVRLSSPCCYGATVSRSAGA
jgi:hypothetical protein